MGKKLNLNIGEPYKEFYGTRFEQMPLLIAEGRVPMNTAQLMQRRLEVRNGPAEVKTAWMDNYFDMRDAIVYHPDGRVKIVLDSEHLEKITSKTPQNEGAITLSLKNYDLLKGEEFQRKEIEKLDKWHSPRDAKAHPLWKFLARDQGLLKDYVSYIFFEGNVRFKDYDALMGVNLFPLESIPKDKLTMGPCRLSDIWNSSNLNGWQSVSKIEGRFIGILPAGLGVIKENSVKVKAYTPLDLQNFDEVIRGLEGILNHNLLKELTVLRKKL